jgi:hypothetical protein
MSAFTFLVVPVIFLLLPVWFIVASYCEAIAARKNQPAGEWLFRGLVLNIVALSEIAFEPVLPSSSNFNLTSGDPFEPAAAKQLLALLLVLVGIPFYSVLGSTVLLVFWRFLEGSAFPACLASWLLIACLMWFPLVWLVSIFCSVLLARYKGVDSKTWALLSCIGAELPVWILLKSESDDDSRAKREHFLEDELAARLVDRLMTAIALPCRILLAVALICLLGFLIGCVVNPSSARYFAVSPRDFLLAALSLCFSFSGWLLAAATSWHLAARKSLNQVKWTLCGFFVLSLAPLVLCFRKSAATEPASALFSPDEKIDDILRWLLVYAQMPLTGAVLLTLAGCLISDLHLAWGWWFSAAFIALICFFLIGQLLFFPLLLVLFWLAKGRRPLSEILSKAETRVLLCLAIAHLIVFSLLLFCLALAACHAGSSL